MASPPCHMGRTTVASSGPSSTILRQLLEEIDSPDKLSRSLRTQSVVSSRRDSPSRTGSNSRPQFAKPSIWVGGSSAAEDARRKLRALDEARLRRQSESIAGSGKESKPLTNQRTPTRLQASERDRATAKVSQAMINDMGFGRAATWLLSEEPSPTCEVPPQIEMRMASSTQSTLRTADHYV